MVNSVRSAAAVLASVLGVVLLCLLSTFGGGVQLVAGTVLIMGGNDNPNGVEMEHQLNGFLDPTSPSYGFPTYELVKVPWAATVLNDVFTYATAQEDGVAKIDAAINATLNAKPGEKVVAVGYSSSADVIIREIRKLGAEGSPAADATSFVVFGDPNRPNGGIYSRFPGLIIPIYDIQFDGNIPDTPYDLTDISWEYDPVSDFPTYPLNLIALLNSLMAFQMLHSNYFPADLSNAIPDPNLTYVAPDGTQYVTIRPPHLPLLDPLYKLGVPPALLQLVEPTLKWFVDLGYDRTIPVGVPTTAQLGPSLDQVIAALPQLVTAILNPFAEPAPSAALPNSAVSLQSSAPSAGSEPSPTLTRSSIGEQELSATLDPSTADTETVGTYTADSSNFDRSLTTPTPAPKPSTPPTAQPKPQLSKAHDDQNLVRDSLRAVVGEPGLTGGSGSQTQTSTSVGTTPQPTPPSTSTPTPTKPADDDGSLPANDGLSSKRSGASGASSPTAASGPAAAAGAAAA